MVLKADGTEVYRTSGGSVQRKSLSTKFVKGLDPKWSPEGYLVVIKKGERTPELVNEYALLPKWNGEWRAGKSSGTGVFLDRLSR